MKQQFKKITLQNGLRILLAPRRASLAATVLVLVEAGSEYETKDTNGISHFLEHLMFKGTVNRPRSDMISIELDALGADYNAFTGEEYTGYWAKAENHKLPKIIELVSDIYLNPIFEPQEIEKERGVIIEEINMYEDTPSDYVHRAFDELLYGDQPAGWKTEGRKEVIRALARDNFVTYRDEQYVAAKTIVVVAGAFNERSVLKQIRSFFGGLPRKKAAKKPKTTEAQKSPRLKVVFRKSAQSHMVLGVRAFSVHDKRRRAVKVLASILGGGASSRLFRKVRDELGAAYYIGAHADLLLDHGSFSVNAGIDNSRTAIVIRAILDEMKQLANSFVPESEFRKAKDHMIGNMIMSLETSDELASFYGTQEVLSRRLVAPEGIIKKIKSVTRAEVRDVARALFVDRHLNLALIGPYKDTNKIRRVLKF